MKTVNRRAEGSAQTSDNAALNERCAGAAAGATRRYSTPATAIIDSAKATNETAAMTSSSRCGE